MSHQVPVDKDARASEVRDGPVHEVLPDLAYQRLIIVNAIYYGVHGAPDRAWVLIDAGVTGSSGMIRSAVMERFGKDSRPHAIVITHGHFDHVGALPDLAERWDVPIYAHPQELQFLNGSTAYPPPDPSVGGGLMAALSRFYPRGPVDVSRWLQPLPADGTVPGMPGFRWLHTPGHTIGHVSLWREMDRTLIAGDAFITTDQESAYAVAMQTTEVHGPPMYYTPDWESARLSVQLLAALEPEFVVTGHGRALEGEAMREAVHTLARNFVHIAVPEHGRYVRTSG